MCDGEDLGSPIGNKAVVETAIEIDPGEESVVANIAEHNAEATIGAIDKPL